jgi:hypothetical protein
MLLANLLRFNRCDFSEICRHEPSPHGTFVYRFVNSNQRPDPPTIAATSAADPGFS